MGYSFTSVAIVLMMYKQLSCHRGTARCCSVADRSCIRGQRRAHNPYV